jgi:hypothetical protein
MITKKQLKREIEELKKQHSKELVKLGREIFKIKNPPKYKIESLVGEYRVIEVTLDRRFGLADYIYLYKCIKNGKHFTMTEKQLTKKLKKKESK